MDPNYRRCVSCRRAAHRQEFWRIVRVYPSQAVQLDQGMGRSAYLCPQASCLQTAQKKNRLGRVLKASVPEELCQLLWQRLSSIEIDSKSQSSEDLCKIREESRLQGQSDPSYPGENP
jgi:uncharacterized protein